MLGEPFRERVFAAQKPVTCGLCSAKFRSPALARPDLVMPVPPLLCDGVTRYVLRWDQQYEGTLSRDCRYGAGEAGVSADADAHADASLVEDEQWCARSEDRLARVRCTLQ